MKKAYFISDLHLGARYFRDARSHERKIVSFLDEIKDDVSELYLLGDILDYWFEYRYVVPRGFVRFFGKLAELSDSGVKIVWLIGNHDIWIFDYLPSELGIEVVDGSIMRNIMGTEFYMEHGDACGSLKRGFRLMRGIFRNKICQALYAAIHPRWTIPFALGWSKSSRKGYGEMFEIGSDGVLNKAMREKMLTPVLATVERERKAHPEIRYFLFGHLHIMERREITPECSMIVLGDWISCFSYGVFDGKCFQLKHYEERNRD